MSDRKSPVSVTASKGPHVKSQAQFNRSFEERLGKSWVPVIASHISPPLPSPFLPFPLLPALPSTILLNALYLSVSEREPVSVDHTSLSEMNIALNDCIIYFFGESIQGLRTNHRSMDIYLATQVILNCLAGIAALYAWFVPFLEGKGILKLIVALYYALYGGYAIWYGLFSKAEIFSGVGSDGTVWSVNTQMKAPSTLYEVTIGIGKHAPKTFKKPVETWFDVTGSLVPDLFIADLQAWVNATAAEAAKA